MKKITIKLALCFLIAIIAVACKPTEQNYREAYENALSKRHKALTSLDGEEGKLAQIDGMHTRLIEGDTVLVLETFVKPMEEQPGPRKNIGVAISKYSMPTNARRQLSDLKETEPEAYIGIDGQGAYFLIIRECEDGEEAVKAMHEFRQNHPGYPFIGLPDVPVLVTISK